MYLSQHFLRILRSRKPGVDIFENSFWMASQTIATGVVMFSAVKSRKTSERLLIEQCYKLERPQVAQIVLTSVISFNIYLVAGTLAAVLTAIALMISLDWRALVLFFEGLSTWKASRGNQLAGLAWGWLHFILAISLLQSVRNFDRKEGQITLPIDEETSSAIPDAKPEVETNYIVSTDVREPPTFLPLSRLLSMFCVLVVLAEALITVVFFGLEKILLPGLVASQSIAAEGLVLAHILTTDAIGVILVVTLTIQELSVHSIIRSLIAGLTES
ncbi:hypothetical protein TWF718_003573 [Orbilia javanica]|uniref:Uncharacterized protein n=1 Tax=Orbilia javanica TaxID=47235 RepID=A0AAN8RED5_9PEZI